MQHNSIKPVLLLGLSLASYLWCPAKDIFFKDGYDPIAVKEANVQGTPKASTIQATINGHLLSIVFLEDLGQVSVEVSYAAGGEVEATAVYTPNGVNFYIPNTGSYIVTFTLSNGDVYYGEFEVTD